MSNGQKPLSIARAALYGTTALVLSAAAFTPAIADEVSDIKIEMQQLLDRMEQLEQDQANTSASVEQTNVRIDQAANAMPWIENGSSVRRRAPIVNQTTTAEDYFVIPETAAEHGVSGGDFPGSFKLPGSDSSMAIYGFVHASYIWNFGSVNRAFPNLIDGNFQPVDGTVGSGIDGNVNFRANPTQINIETRTPSEFGEIRTHVQIDTFNTDNEGGPNNSTIGQLVVGTRLMQGSIGSLTLGQHWWAMTDFAQYGETVDYNNNSHAPLGRLVGLTWAESVGGGLSYAVGAYDPVTQIGAPRGVINAALTATTPFTTNDSISVPMFAGNVTYAQDWGHVFFGGQVRQVQYEVDSSTAFGQDTTIDNWIAAGNPTSDTETAWGLTLSVNLLDPLGLGSSDRLFGGISYGRGFRGFLNTSLDCFQLTAGTGAGCTNEGEVNPFNGDLDLNKNFGWSTSYQHWWTDTIRSTIMWSHVSNNSDNDFDVAGSQRMENSAWLNLFWSPVPRVNLGMELNYQDQRVKQNDGNELANTGATLPVGEDSSDSIRFQLGAIFLY